MSEWYEAKDDDIAIDKDIEGNNEVQIYVTSNDFGAVYVTLTFDQIKEIHKTIIETEG